MSEAWQPLRPERWRNAWKYSLETAVKPGYGQRKVARERAKIPLLADLPGMVASADEYERAMAESNVERGREMRRSRADAWCRLRQALDGLSVEDRRAWYLAWSCVPHDPCYGLDAVRQLDHWRQCLAREATGGRGGGVGVVQT